MRARNRHQLNSDCHFWVVAASWEGGKGAATSFSQCAITLCHYFVHALCETTLRDYFASRHGARLLCVTTFLFGVVRDYFCVAAFSMRCARHGFFTTRFHAGLLFHSVFTSVHLHFDVVTSFSILDAHDMLEDSPVLVVNWDLVHRS